MVGDRDRPARAPSRSRAACQPGSRSPASGRCACGGRRGSRPTRDPAADVRLPPGSWRRRRCAGRSPRPGRRPPQSRSAPWPFRRAHRRSAGLASRRSTWPARVIASPGWNSRPRSPSRISSCRAGAASTPGRCPRRAPCARGRARGAGRRRPTSDVGAGDQLLRRGVPRPQDVDPVAQPPATPHLGGARVHTAPPSHSAGRRRIARRKRRSAPRSSSRQNAIRTGRSAPVAVARPEALDPGSAPGLHPLVGAGEEPLDQLRRGARAHRAGIEPPEEDLHQGPGDLRRQDPLLGSWNVPTFSEREWRSATAVALGANGSWTWTTSKSTPPSSSSSGRLRSIGTGAARGPGHGASRCWSRPRGPAGPRPARTLPAAVEQRRRVAGARCRSPGGTRGPPPATRTALRRRPDALDPTAPPTRDRRTR